MPKEDSVLRLQGEVEESLPNALFRVELESGIGILANLSGKMKIHSIKVVPGDWVTVELTAYNLTRGRIVTRLKPDEARPLALAKAQKKVNAST